MHETSMPPNLIARREAVESAIRLYKFFGTDRYVPMRDVGPLTDAILTTLGSSDAEAETYRQMHEIATGMGFPSILEALETLEASDADTVRVHRFGSPPEPVANPNADWCEAYADWYYQGKS